MNLNDFNARARYVYTKLLPLVQAATDDRVEGLSYESCGDDEEVVAHFADGSQCRVTVTGRNYFDMAVDVLKAVA